MTSLLLFTIFLLSRTRGVSSILVSSCRNELGISNSSIVTDSQLTATSYLYEDKGAFYHFKPNFARLKTVGGGGAWCSKNVNKGQYIQVNLLRNLKIAYIETQGRYGGQEFVQSFKLRYQRKRDTVWRILKDQTGKEYVFSGNNDTDTIVGNAFPRSIIASKVRLLPKGDYFSIHCLRMEMLGCKLKNEFLESYSAPSGIHLGKFDFTDKTYDGNFDNKTKLWSCGIGQLVDGFTGTNDLRKGWVGFNASQIPLIFIFIKPLNFGAVVLRMRTLARTEKLLESVEVQTSNDGKNYAMERKIDTVMKHGNDEEFVLNINVYSTRFLKFILTKNEKDILLISEVSIVKGPPRKTTTIISKWIPTTAKPKRMEFSTKERMKDTLKVLRKDTDKNIVTSQQKTARKFRIPVTFTAPNDAVKAQETRGGSKRTKSFYIILGIGTSVAAIFTMLIIVLICFLRKDKSDGKVSRATFNQNQQGSDARKVSEPLLKTTEFQGVCGTSKFIAPDKDLADDIAPEQEIQNSAVEFENKIGGGRFGEVFIGQIVSSGIRMHDNDVSDHVLAGQKVFIEMLTKGASVEKSSEFFKEICSFSCLKHPNVCRLVAVCTKNEPMFMLTECLEGMRLDSYLANLNQSSNARKGEILADIVVKIARALKYLASIKFVHRDISARNILYGIGSVVKITNTAAACPGYYDCYYYLKEKHGLLPIRWMAPETLDEANCCVRSDVWSFGVLLWEIYTFAKVIPFDRMANLQVLDGLKALYREGTGNVEYLPLKFLNCPKLIIQILLRCWSVSPNQRITADEIYETLMQ